MGTVAGEAVSIPTLEGKFPSRTAAVETCIFPQKLLPEGIKLFVQRLLVRDTARRLLSKGFLPEGFLPKGFLPEGFLPEDFLPEGSFFLSLLGPSRQLSLLVITYVTKQSCYLDSKVTGDDCDQLSLLQL